MPYEPDKRRIRQMRSAEGFLELNMPDHALRELDQIEESSDSIYAISVLRGESFLIKREHQRALEQFVRAHLDKPVELLPMLKMAWCFKRTDQIERAIEAMKLAYQFHKSDAMVLYNMSCYYALAGDKENALSWLGRSLRMDRKYLDMIPNETDFDSLRDDPDFQHLLELTANPNP